MSLGSLPHTPGLPAVSLSEVPQFPDALLQALLQFWTAWGVVHTSLFSPTAPTKYNCPSLAAVHLDIIAGYHRGASGATSY